MLRFSVVFFSKSCAILSVTLILSAFGFVQTIPQGITQWSTQIHAGPVSVDMLAGTMQMRIPVLKKPGAIPYVYEIFDDLNTEGYLNSDNAFLGLVSSINSGLGHPNFTNCGPGPTNFSRQYGAGISTHQWWVADGTGSKHYFVIPDGILVGPLQQGCGGDWGPDTVTAADGSGYTAVVTGSQILNGTLTWVLYDKSGNEISSSGSSFTDPDGNSISNTDTLGEVPITVSLGRSTGNPDTYTYTDVNGGSQTYTVFYSSQHVKTIFGCSGNPYDVDHTGVYLPSSITLPTGASYVIAYESTPGFPLDVTGRLGKVTLPSGGYVSFAYSGGHGGGLNGFDCNYQTIPQIQISVNDNNGHTSTTTYVRSYVSPITVTATDTLGDVTTHYFGGATEAERITSDSHKGKLHGLESCWRQGRQRINNPANRRVQSLQQWKLWWSVRTSGYPMFTCFCRCAQ